MFLDPETTIILSRIQFALSLTYHIIFPSINIGIIILIAFWEYLWIKTNKQVYYNLTRMWTRIFALAFGMGVVSGIVLAFTFGTNFAKFSMFTGNIIGPLLSYEVLTAFFLEATFLGVMLFGWKKVSPKQHFYSTIVVLVGTLISAFWILSANSWMQTPTGHKLGIDGLLYVDKWVDVIFNPSFKYRYIHMIMASFLTGSILIAAVSAWYLIKNKFLDEAKIAYKHAILMLAILAPLQILIGDLHGLKTLEHQPMKVAAMEGRWETMKGAPFILFGIPDQEQEKNHYEIKIPYAASLVLTHSLDGEVKGLKEVSKEDRPNVFIVFWCFRIMVAIGFYLLLLGSLGTFKYFRKTLYNCKILHIMSVFSGPLGIIAVICGWYVTEVGRQPWVVQGLLRTSESVSDIIAENVLFSLLAYSGICTLFFIAFIYFFFKTIHKGPEGFVDKEEISRTAWFTTDDKEV